MNCYTGACVEKGATLSFCDTGASLTSKYEEPKAYPIYQDEAKEASKSSESSPSLERPTMEEQVDRLGEIMEACGKRSAKVIACIQLDVKSSYFCIPDLWENITMALFKEMVGVKCFTECPAMQSRIVSIPSGDNLHKMAEQMRDLTKDEERMES